MVISHVPVAHDSPAFASAQVVPQAPQLVSEVSAVSQPFTVEPSQLPCPAVQAPSVQVPAAQLSAAFARSHTFPQVPQCVSDESDASQPFESLPSQLPEPGLHDPIEQVPLAHVALAPERAHVAPHAHRLWRVRIDVSQPSASVELQSP